MKTTWFVLLPVGALAVLAIWYRGRRTARQQPQEPSPIGLPGVPYHL